MTYSPILDAEMLPGKPPKSSLFFRLRDNVLAIIGRDGGPIVQVPVREYKTSGTAATWTIPAGVTAFNIYVGGGCGGTGGSPGSNSTVVYNGVTYTGGAGSSGAGVTGGAGGTATNGDINITGQRGATGGTDGAGGAGGTRAVWGGAGANGTDGAFGSSGGGGAGAGGMCVKRIVVVPGQTTATYTVGAGGTGADGGLIIFEY